MEQERRGLAWLAGTRAYRSALAAKIKLDQGLISWIENDA